MNYRAERDIPQRKCIPVLDFHIRTCDQRIAHLLDRAQATTESTPRHPASAGFLHGCEWPLSTRACCQAYSRKR